MNKKVNIEQESKKHKNQLFNKYPIKTIAIFGSYARGDQNDHSDVDLLVEVDGKIGVLFVDLAEELESILKIPVDLVSKNGIKDKYYQQIKKDLIHV